MCDTGDAHLYDFRFNAASSIPAAQDRLHDASAAATMRTGGQRVMGMTKCNNEKADGSPRWRSVHAEFQESYARALPACVSFLHGCVESCAHESVETDRCQAMGL